MAAKPPCWGAGFSSFGGVEFRFLIIFSKEFAKLSLITARDNSLTAVTLAYTLINFEIFTQKIDSTFDSTNALINKTGSALRAQIQFCWAFVESNVESRFC